MSNTKEAQTLIRASVQRDDLSSNRADFIKTYEEDLRYFQDVDLDATRMSNQTGTEAYYTAQHNKASTTAWNSIVADNSIIEDEFANKNMGSGNIRRLGTKMHQQNYSPRPVRKPEAPSKRQDTPTSSNQSMNVSNGRSICQDPALEVNQSRNLTSSSRIKNNTQSQVLTHMYTNVRRPKVKRQECLKARSSIHPGSPLGAWSASRLATNESIASGEHLTYVPNKPSTDLSSSLNNDSARKMSQSTTSVETEGIHGNEEVSTPQFVASHSENASIPCQDASRLSSCTYTQHLGDSKSEPFTTASVTSTSLSSQAEIVSKKTSQDATLAELVQKYNELEARLIRLETRRSSISASTLISARSIGRFDSESGRSTARSVTGEQIQVSESALTPSIANPFAQHTSFMRPPSNDQQEILVEFLDLNDTVEYSGLSNPRSGDRGSDVSSHLPLTNSVAGQPQSMKPIRASTEHTHASSVHSDLILDIQNPFSDSKSTTTSTQPMFSNEFSTTDPVTMTETLVPNTVKTSNPQQTHKLEPFTTMVDYNQSAYGAHGDIAIKSCGGPMQFKTSQISESTLSKGVGFGLSIEGIQKKTIFSGDVSRSRWASMA